MELIDQEITSKNWRQRAAAAIKLGKRSEEPETITALSQLVNDQHYRVSSRCYRADLSA